MTEMLVHEPESARAPLRSRTLIHEHIVEILSDSGEGAQRCGQSFAAIAAKSGRGIWNVEIIPAEIQPPARSVAGGSPRPGCVIGSEESTFFAPARAARSGVQLERGGSP